PRGGLAPPAEQLPAVALDLRPDGRLAVRFAVARVLHRQDELEARAVWVGILVDEITVVGASVRPRDREAEARPTNALAGAGEALEQVRNELLGHAFAP